MFVPAVLLVRFPFVLIGKSITLLQVGPSNHNVFAGQPSYSFLRNCMRQHVTIDKVEIIQDTADAQ